MSEADDNRATYDVIITDARLERPPEDRAALEACEEVGCFYCLRTYAPDTIREWVRASRGGQALCPHCRIDAVVACVDETTLTALMERGFHFGVEATAELERVGVTEDTVWGYRRGSGGRDVEGPLALKYGLQNGSRVLFKPEPMIGD